MAVSIGAVGLGLLGRIECEHYTAFDDAEVTAGVDISPEAREVFESSYDRPTYESVEDLLVETGEELDAVSIVTPHTLHYEQAKACLEAGLHVFVEKPLTTDLDEARELVEIAARHDLVLQVGFQRHFDPAFAELRSIVESDQIGVPHTANCYLGQQWITEHEDSWRTTPSLSGGGQLFDSGTHLIDSMLWALDATPSRVTGVADNQGHDVDVNSALAATLSRDGTPITASVCVSGAGTDTTPVEGIAIWGTEGHVSLTDGELTVTTQTETETIEITEDRDFDTLTAAKLRNFVDSVAGRADPAVTGEYGLAVTAFLESAYEAIQTGSAVDVNDDLGGENA